VKHVGRRGRVEEKRREDVVRERYLPSRRGSCGFMLLRAAVECGGEVIGRQLVQ
jgi:hypothetical protein